MDMVLTLILLPIIASILLLMLPNQRAQYVVITAVLFFLGIGAFSLYTSMGLLTFQLSHTMNLAIVAADVLLLLFFLYQGRVFNHPKVMALAAVQLVLYGYIELIAPESGSAEIMVDSLSKFMFLIINGVGGIIVLYSVKYMEDEPASPLKKRLFVGGLLVFLSVMNLIVIANSILLFFFLFEMTTLASYLLIAFRDDDVSRANALKALWMNQIGGVVILLGALVAIIGFKTVMFDTLLQSSGGMVLFSIALLSMAALVKGASIPFEGWLLGAMVAPTPVSAMLHSATMVKIAPYLILKLAPALAVSMVGGIISIIGALVFVAASYLALSRSVLKEILGYSTVALLGLMMALAAIGSEESMNLAMALMLFHALSKALLFLSAGVLERLHHAKDIEDMKGMVTRSPKTVGFILFGFVSLTLPPFGLFMGKLFAISSIAALLKEHPSNLIILLSLIVGSALMVLLYFKVASALLSAPSDIRASEAIAIPNGFNVPLVLLSFFIVIGALGYIMLQHNIFVVLLALPMLFVFALPTLIRRMDRYDRSQPYHCGEKESFNAALVYYEPSLKLQRILYWGFGSLFVAVAIVGALS
ncbi:MAG: proton-conducting transporter membrane subunit [Sulfuricurvum sp.]|uniref:proton-conducting transporter transmembrane domain-containing protein n=1 Tax=Sulfuricurvum sp. TaxID=2025608 RepID=UPI002736DC64|nr:proton-conducting transporter membrane subunit [Sulfuricurvum sp.]MDP2850612.1 proton-conducting transporter membrane subunit [Sulfuricurvum sp.]